VRAFLGLGSNLGDRWRYLREAVAGLPDVAAVSPVYETAPVAGPEGQGSVLAAEVDLGRGASAQLVVRFELPGGAHRLVRVVPSARLPAVTWQVPATGSSPVRSVGRFDDSQPHALAF